MRRDHKIMKKEQFHRLAIFKMSFQFKNIRIWIIIQIFLLMYKKDFIELIFKSIKMYTNFLLYDTHVIIYN